MPTLPEPLILSASAVVPPVVVVPIAMALSESLCELAKCLMYACPLAPET